MTVVNRIVNRIRRTAKWEYRKARYRFGQSVRELSVDEGSAQFEVDTFQEFIRIEDVMQEADLISAILDSIASDDVFWDIGANIGTHSCLVGSLGAKVVAVEARPGTAEKLEKNLKRNDVDWRVVNAAMDRSEGTVVIGVDPGTPQALGTGSFSILRGNDDGVEVPATTGAALVADGVERPTVVKIDVEGAEERVLDGMGDALTDCRVLFCEVHLEQVTEASIRKRLEDLGFDTVVQLGRRDEQVHLKATRS